MISARRQARYIRGLLSLAECLSATHPNTTGIRVIRVLIYSPCGSRVSIVCVFRSWIAFRSGILKAQGELRMRRRRGPEALRATCDKVATDRRYARDNWPLSWSRASRTPFDSHDA